MGRPRRRRCRGERAGPARREGRGDLGLGEPPPSPPARARARGVRRRARDAPRGRSRAPRSSRPGSRRPASPSTGCGSRAPRARRTFARVLRDRPEPAARTSSTRISSTPTSTASSRGRSPAFRVRVSTKHGFNAFRDRRLFGLADRAVAQLADVHIAISAGLAGYLAEREGFDVDAFEIVHYGIEPGPPPLPLPGVPRLAVVGRLIPIKGHDMLLRALAVARRDVPGVTLEIAGDGALEADLRSDRDRARPRRHRHVPRSRRAHR